jgi:hypothetical protein
MRPSVNGKVKLASKPFSIGHLLSGKAGILSVLAATSIASAPSQAQEANYFRACGADDVILASGGKWYEPKPRGRHERYDNEEWVFAGEYTPGPGIITAYRRGEAVGTKYYSIELISQICN